MKAPPLPKSALSHADMMRGIAAIAVVVGHVRGLFFVDWPKVTNHSLAMRAVYMLTGLGHQSVVVFFVLSGFFIGHSVLRSQSTGTWSWRHFLLNRFTRLYVVLIPALVATAALDLLGMHLYGIADNTYGGHLDAPLLTPVDVSKTVGLPTFFGNLFFLQSIFVDSYGSNGPLWSLSYEFWCYLVFPLLVRAASRSSGAMERGASAIGAIAILACGGKPMLLYFGIWCMGALVAGVWWRVVPREGLLRPIRAIAWLGFVGAISVARLNPFQSVPLGDYIAGAATTLFVSSLLWSSHAAGGQAAGPRYAHAAHVLAGFSYTLYLVHMPVVTFLNVAVVGPVRWMPEPTKLAIGAAVVFAICALWAYPMSRVTEAHTDAVRRRVARVLRIGRAETA